MTKFSIIARNGLLHINSRSTISTLPSSCSENSPKLFDSSSESNKSLSTPGFSIEIQSPTFSVIPPTPPTSPPKQEAQFLGPSKPELKLWTSEIKDDIHALLAAIKDYESFDTESRERTLSELDAILDLVSDATLVHTKLQILTSHIANFYREQKDIFTSHLNPICTSLPTAWNTFLSLPLDEQQHHAKTQAQTSPIMKLFTGLSEVRRCSEVQREINEKVAKRLSGCFEDMLGELKGVGAEEAAMKWRVLGIVVRKRREVLEGCVLEILRVRMGVSAGLMGLVDLLAESD